MRHILPIFGRSPFKPLQSHMDKVQEVLALLPPFFEAFLRDEKDRVRELRRAVMKLEHEADVIKNELRDHLPKSYFMPVDRRDLLRLLHQQDEVADRCEDIVVVATLREPLPFPRDLEPRLIGVLEQSISACAMARRIIGDLDQLLESSFGGPEADHVVTLIGEVGQAEHEVDKAVYTLAQELYRRESDLGILPMLLWQKILELLGGLANSAESIGDQVRLMIHR